MSRSEERRGFHLRQRFYKYKYKFTFINKHKIPPLLASVRRFYVSSTRSTKNPAPSCFVFKTVASRPFPPFPVSFAL